MIAVSGAALTAIFFFPKESDMCRLSAKFCVFAQKLSSLWSRTLSDIHCCFSRSAKDSTSSRAETWLTVTARMRSNPTSGRKKSNRTSERKKRSYRRRRHEEAPNEREPKTTRQNKDLMRAVNRQPGFRPGTRRVFCKSTKTAILSKRDPGP